MTWVSDRIDPRALRQALGKFATGVTVVTTTDAAGRPRGFTANSFTSVSLDPPLVLVCVGDKATSFPAFNRCHSYTVNILGAGQKGIAETFASKSVDKFEHVEWSLGANGAPRIAHSLAVLECQVDTRIPAGDHLVLIGKLIAFSTDEQEPLVYHAGGYLQAFATRSEQDDAQRQVWGKT